jgi:hypothetical protein
MTSLWRRHPRLVAAFLVALALAIFFTGKIVWRTVWWSQHQQEQVMPWMTVGYVGRSWGLDPREIDERAGLPMPQGKPLTLKDIAAQRGVPVSEIVALVETTVQQMLQEEAARHQTEGRSP